MYILNYYDFIIVSKAALLIVTAQFLTRLYKSCSVTRLNDGTASYWLQIERVEIHEKILKETNSETYFKYNLVLLLVILKFIITVASYQGSESSINRKIKVNIIH